MILLQLMIVVYLFGLQSLGSVFFHSLLLLQEVELQHGRDAHKNLLRAGSVPSLGTSKPAKSKTLLYHNDNDTRSQEALPTISLSAIKCNKVTTITV